MLLVRVLRCATMLASLGSGTSLLCPRAAQPLVAIRAAFDDVLIRLVSSFLLKLLILDAAVFPLHKYWQSTISIVVPPNFTFLVGVGSGKAS